MKQLQNVDTGRMRHLADFLETVPPERFTLAQWEQPKTLFDRLNPWCGFAGCAIGWAVHTNLFPGLRLAKVPGSPIWPYKDVVYKGAVNTDAVAVLFGITECIAAFLVHQDCYEEELQTPYHVALRLRRFAKIVDRRVARHQPKAKNGGLRVVA